MPVTLDNQVALVLGASSGIGRETAILLAREGARVMAAARRQDRLLELQQSLARQGHAIEIAAVDASHAAEMDRLAAHTAAQLGPVDLLVYVTGTNTPDRSLKRLTAEIWDRMLRVNLYGAYYAAAAVLPSMRERRSGHLIFVSSISALVPDVSGAAYQAAKRGMVGLSHAIRVEEKENGIRTCVVCPGLVDTELLNLRPVKTPAETVAKALQPLDVAEAILAVAKMPPRVSIPEMQILPTVL